MDSKTRQYIKDQCMKYSPLNLNHPNTGQIKLKLRSAQGKTNWLNISTKQALAIEHILCD